MTEPMTDERLANTGKALVVADGPTIAHELYDEVQRLRGVETELREAVRLEREAFDMRGARVVQQRAELAAAWKERDAATTRAEIAERELAEVRGLLAEHPDEWGVAEDADKYGDTVSAGSHEDVARRSVANDPEHRKLMHRRGASQWKAIGDD